MVYIRMRCICIYISNVYIARRTGMIDISAITTNLINLN